MHSPSRLTDRPTDGPTDRSRTPLLTWAAPSGQQVDKQEKRQIEEDEEPQAMLGVASPVLVTGIPCCARWDADPGEEQALSPVRPCRLCWGSCGNKHGPIRPDAGFLESRRCPEKNLEDLSGNPVVKVFRKMKIVLR
ncbi:hypothetical protein HGM15179_015282 [Zosterops borbonicus]|uniref:Uncharacterized protein n=1 Tax=Zosterops borbonicus TaxID=364589 RepID=A0A8K1LFG6_9PASS|nr:hypothetical protein HGM15179_015282 [Zosterops borbonicus]